MVLYTCPSETWILDKGWNICLNKTIKQTVGIFSTVNRILTYLNGSVFEVR